MFDFLSQKINAALRNLPADKLYEIRLRADRPLTVNFNGDNLYLCPGGVSIAGSGAFRLTSQEIGDIMFNLCERSVYSYTDKIRKGFITLKGGVRVGLCGECVVEGGEIRNVKNITSLNIRIPHAVKGCSDKIMSIYGKNVKSTLVVSPPGVGKTTLIRDLAERISQKFMLSVLVADERNEIFPLISNADTVDCMVNCPKIYAFENGIRSMSPDVIVTDELIGNEDISAVSKAMRSGVKVIATMHGKSIESVRKVAELFEVAVSLDESNGKGTIREVCEL